MVCLMGVHTIGLRRMAGGHGPCWDVLALLTKEAPMPTSKLDVSKGPDKADLLRAVTNPEEHLHVTFSSAGGLVEAHLDKIKELSDGVAFGLRGQIVSGDPPFAGTYDTTSRTGQLVLKEAA
jgi:hypothetical protein